MGGSLGDRHYGCYACTRFGDSLLANWPTVKHRLFVCPYFGPLPAWWPEYVRLTPRGYDFLFDRDLPGFVERVREQLGIACPIREGDGKIHDYRACLGELYADEIAGYEWWGHTDFDCVYGDLAAFTPDELLADLDVVSDHWSYLCGPMTLYRTGAADSLFREHADWEAILEEPAVSGWVETDFTQLLNSTGLRVRYDFRHGYEHPERLRREGVRLFEGEREVSFFHFRRTKRWPVIA